MYMVLAWSVFPACLLLVCLFAWLVGAAAERYGSLMILGATVAADVLLKLSYPQFPSTGMCAVDFALAAGLLAIALIYSNYWLGAAMLLQSIVLALQALDLSGDGPSNFIHIVVNDNTSLAMLLCLAAGIFGSWRKRLKQRQTGTAASASDRDLHRIAKAAQQEGAC